MFLSVGGGHDSARSYQGHANAYKSRRQKNTHHRPTLSSSASSASYASQASPSSAAYSQTSADMGHIQSSNQLSSASANQHIRQSSQASNHNSQQNDERNQRIHLSNVDLSSNESEGELSTRSNLAAQRAAANSIIRIEMM